MADTRPCEYCGEPLGRSLTCHACGRRQRDGESSRPASQFDPLPDDAPRSGATRESAYSATFDRCGYCGGLLGGRPVCPVCGRRQPDGPPSVTTAPAAAADTAGWIPAGPAGSAPPWAGGAGQRPGCQFCGSPLDGGTACPVCGRRQAILPADAWGRPWGPAVDQTVVVVPGPPLSYWRPVGFVFGLALLGAFGGLTAAAIQLGYDGADPWVVSLLGLLAAATLLSGLLVCGLAWTPGFVAVSAVMSAVLLLAGGSLVSAAPIIAEDEGDWSLRPSLLALVAGGAGCLLLGLVLAAILWRLSRRPGAWLRVLPVARWLAVAAGVEAGLSGLVLALNLPFVSSLQSETSETTTLQGAATLAAIAALGLVPGVILTFHGISAAMGEDSSRSRLPPAGAVLALLALALALGGLAMRLDQPPAALMPPLHVAAGFLPGLALVGVAAGTVGVRSRRGQLTWRQVLLAAAISMAGATTFAGILETWAGSGVLAAVLAFRHAFQDTESIRSARDVFADYQDILSDGQVLAVLLLMMSVVAPLVEEFFKGASARVMMTAETRRRDAFVLGALAGAGFGAFEALTYGLGGLDPESGIDWWSLMLIRGGASGMHALGAGLVALGWYDAIHGRGWRWFRWYGAAVLLHGTWNGLNVLVGTRLLFPLESLSDVQLQWLIYGVISPLAVLSVGGVAWIGARLRAAEPAEEPLPLIEPLLGAPAFS